jgi:hypothetical protein
VGIAGACGTNEYGPLTPLMLFSTSQACVVSKACPRLIPVKYGLNSQETGHEILRSN